MSTIIGDGRIVIDGVDVIDVRFDADAPVDLGEVRTNGEWSRANFVFAIELYRVAYALLRSERLADAAVIGEGS